ncbi:MAG: DUF4139 domain-containing protein [Chromatiaceae bacterium]|nr:DUF4139 domain-containing protein [Chromatiaceae bacterium]MBP8283273.1 DUF4139 domain-containing protein [Chromatiaceae bacterium]
MNASITPLCLLPALLWSHATMAATAEERRSTLDDQTAVAVTIYNEDLALVKDRRQLELPVGGLDLAFRDVSARIQPETALLRGLTEGANLKVIEQNFDFDLLTPGKLLEKYVGRPVGVIKVHPTTGEETEEEATVLAAAEGTVLRIGDRIETGQPGRIVFRELPPNLRNRPTLVMKLDNGLAGPQELELSYLTAGLSWKADYVGELAAADSHLDLTGWVTLNNTSGTAYRDAQLQLVAGDVNRVRDLPSPAMQKEGMRMMAAAAPMMEEEALFEYHLYSLARPTTIADNQSKQVALLAAQGIPARKELIFKGNDYYYRAQQGEIGVKLKASVFLEIDNREEANLGMPLPKGVVRIYKKDSQGKAQFVGEDHIDHTPKNETLRLKLGEAFDVTADKTQTDFVKLSGTGPWQYQFETAYRIRLRNAKPEAVTVKVREPIPGDWKILESSHPHQKVSANLAEWEIKIPAEGETVLTYRVRVRF